MMSRASIQPHRANRTILCALAAVAFVAMASCAYYNTLYNANTKYKEAEKQPLDRDGKPNRSAVSQYDEVIGKCQTMIGTWPDSRHVDDAMLLIANCLYQQQRFDECVVQLDTLEIKFPKTELLAQVYLLKGKSLSQWGQHEDAIATLNTYLERWPRQRSRPEALFYLTTSSIELGQYVAAVEHVRELQKKYHKSEFTFRAQLNAASILVDKQMYERAAEIYGNLNEDRLPIGYRYEVWSGLTEVYLRMGRFSEALELVQQLELLQLTPETEPIVRLQKGTALVGMDSTEAAIRTYKYVTERFSRGEYAAEAYYRLGEIWEAADSLDRARRNFEQVPRAFARSDRATDAIRRAGSISQLIKLEQSQNDDSPEVLALREFTLAELQFTQFNQPDKALETYSGLLNKYPDSEYGPPSAYAIGYIYGVVMGDTLQARQAYDVLLSRYPDSQQAEFAYLFVPGMKSDKEVE